MLRELAESPTGCLFITIFAALIAIGVWLSIRDQSRVERDLALCVERGGRVVHVHRSHGGIGGEQWFCQER